MNFISVLDRLGIYLTIPVGLISTFLDLLLLLLLLLLIPLFLLFHFVWALVQLSFHSLSHNYFLSSSSSIGVQVVVHLLMPDDIEVSVVDL